LMLDAVKLSGEGADEALTAVVVSEVAPPLIALARDVVGIRYGVAPSGAKAPAAKDAGTELATTGAKLTAATLEPAVLRLLTDAANGNEGAVTVVRRIVGQLTAAQRMGLAPILMS
ncbi:MAG: hypothetical protein RI826_09955, partial [Chlorobium phaeovibrioides]|nr:hypothetical protein [Chlorobium phaeovibrioides]